MCFLLLREDLLAGAEEKEVQEDHCFEHRFLVGRKGYVNSYRISHWPESVSAGMKVDEMA